MDGLHRQVVGGTYQFFLIVVLGGGVAWLYRELARIRDRQEHERREFLELYSEVVRAYNQSKTVKRLLRAQAWREVENAEGKTQNVLLTQPYAALMDQLNGVQLEFESLKRHVKARDTLFCRVDAEEEQEALYDDLETIEKYLNRIVNEYETALRKWLEPPQYLPLGSVERVEDFIAPGSDATEIRIGAKDCFKSAIKKLSQVARELER